MQGDNQNHPQQQNQLGGGNLNHEENKGDENGRRARSASNLFANECSILKQAHKVLVADRAHSVAVKTNIKMIYGALRAFYEDC